MFSNSISRYQIGQRLEVSPGMKFSRNSTPICELEHLVLLWNLPQMAPSFLAQFQSGIRTSYLVMAMLATWLMGLLLILSLERSGNSL
ncbi:hypothetical protein SASPL_128924 [Salvia splendens]|uniref:Uncharacterized protein n=1 Tax=Salvia splendens TaxID=180675 RepID=A0A8X8XF31_SALSN|nr:hypothetical protein SASPL_128924 [Salvia splendens]